MVEVPVADEADLVVRFGPRPHCAARAAQSAARTGTRAGAATTAPPRSQEAEPGERAEGLEPQVSPRQLWLPAVTRSGWPGEGTRTPGFVVEIPGYLANKPHHG
ncbi:hypothetical protein AB1E18_006595 [Capra hircus]